MKIKAEKRSWHDNRFGPTVGFAQGFNGRNIGTEREEQTADNSFYFVTAHREGLKVQFAQCTSLEEVGHLQKVIAEARKAYKNIITPKKPATPPEDAE